MAANGTLVRPVPSIRRGRQLALLAGALIAADLVASLFVTHEQGQAVRVFGAAGGIAIVVWFALGTRSALVAFGASWGVLHSFLFSADTGTSAGGGQSLTLSRAVGGALVVGVGLGLLTLRRRGVVRLTPPLVAASLFLAFYGLDVVIAPSLSVGVGDFFRLASGILVGVAAFYVFDTRDRLLQLSRFVFLGGVAVAGMTLVQFALTRVAPSLAHAIYGHAAYVRSYDQTHGTNVARVNGALGGPGETSGFLLVTASFGLLRYALLRDTAQRRGIAAGIALMGLAIVATLTRASTAAFVLLILIWLIQRQLRFVSPVGMRTKVLALGVALVVLAVPVLGANTLHTRLWDINPTSSGTSFAQGRGGIWSAEIKRLEASNVPQLLLGHGAHTAEIQLGTDANGQPALQSPHNLLIWLLIETGLIGFALYIAFLIGAVRRYRAAARWRRYEDAGKVGAVGLAGLIAYQVQGMFLLSPTSPGHGIYFMLFVGATLRACTAAPDAWRAASAKID